MLRISAPLWDAFRRGDERMVLSLLHERGDLRHIDNEGALRAACWYGMADVARYLVESCASALDMDMPCVARMRGYNKLAVWLEDLMILQTWRDMDKLQLSFIT